MGNAQVVSSKKETKQVPKKGRNPPAEERNPDPHRVLLNYVFHENRMQQLYGMPSFFIEPLPFVRGVPDMNPSKEDVLKAIANAGPNSKSLLRLIADNCLGDVREAAEKALG